MVHENEINMIINFTEDADKKPMKVGKTYHFKDLTLTVHNKIKMSDHLVRTQFSLFNVTAPRAQYRHHTDLFECTSWPNDSITSSKDTQDLVSSILLIRSEMKLDESAIKVLLHDSQGGLSSSATFLALYNLLQTVDECFTETNQLKSSVKKIDVFGTVNRLRKDRAGMINSYETYNMLYHCLNYYGPNRIELKKLVPMQVSSKSGAHTASSPRKVTRKRTDDTNGYHSEKPDEDNEIQYVIDESDDNEDQVHFEDYYDEYLMPSPSYQNINDMSEYLN
jgi:protein tyrosine phosphatase